MRSSTDAPADTWVDAIRDTGHLIAFRGRTVRRRRASVLGLVVVLALTASVAVGPTMIDVDAVDSSAFTQALRSLEGNLGATFVGFLLLAISASLGSGGGRELMSRSEGAIHPISPVTEHLGALALAPLNLAWLVQMWGLLAVTALVTPPERLLGAQLVVLAWVLAATALGQAVGWTAEGVRRTTHGVVVVRVAIGVVVVVLAGLHLAGALGPLVRALPTTWVAESAQTSTLAVGRPGAAGPGRRRRRAGRASRRLGARTAAA